MVLIIALTAIGLPASASANYSLVDYQSAADALLAVDSTLDPPPNDPNRDFAVGGFQGQDNNNVGFSGHGDALLGSDPQGHLSETIPLFFPMASSTYQGRFRVTCIAVTLNEAAIGLVPTDVASQDQSAEFILSVRDNRGTGFPDDYEFFFDPNPGVIQASDCAIYVGFASFPVAHGNILVNDALPLP
jgi:hypothetical protein